MIQVSSLFRSTRVLVAGLLLLAPATAGARVSLGGVMAHSPDDIAGFATVTDDDDVQTVMLPFEFLVEGVAYERVAVSTNG